MISQALCAFSIKFSQTTARLGLKPTSIDNELVVMHRSNELYPVQARAIFAAFLFHLQTTVILSHIKSLSASGMKVVQMHMDDYSMLLECVWHVSQMFL